MEELAPSVWREFVHHESPGEFYNSLNDHEQHLVTSWQEKRGSILRDRLQKEVEAELECDEELGHESIPFQRVLVQSFDFPSKDIIESSHGKPEEGLLTIWKPTEEQMSYLKEGMGCMFRNLQVRDHKYDGLLQFTSNNKTSIDGPVKCSEKVSFQLKRRNHNLLRLTVLSKKLTRDYIDSETSTVSNDYDTAIALIDCSRDDPRALKGIVLYGSDETGLILRIHCDADHHGVEKLSRDPFPVIIFNDLKILRYDEKEGCAVARFCDTSSANKGTSNRAEQLRVWAASRLAHSSLTLLQKHLSAKLPHTQRGSSIKAVGYVVGVKASSAERLLIEVDCKRPKICEWDFPLSLLPVLSTYAIDNPVALNPERQALCSNLGILSSALLIPNVLLEFQLVRKGHQYSVVHLQKIDPLNLVPFYLP